MTGLAGGAGGPADLRPQAGVAPAAQVVLGPGPATVGLGAPAAGQPYRDAMPDPPIRRMTSASPELLITIAVLILSAVAVGTFAARLFMAASRPRPTGHQPRDSRP